MTVQAKIEPSDTVAGAPQRRRIGLGRLRGRAVAGLSGVVGFLAFARRSILWRAGSAVAAERDSPAAPGAMPPTSEFQPGHYTVATLPPASAGARSILAAIDQAAPFVEVSEPTAEAAAAEASTGGRLDDAPAPSVRLDDGGRAGARIDG